MCRWCSKPHIYSFVVCNKRITFEALGRRRGPGLLLLDGLRGLGQALDLESLSRLEEGRKLVLGHVDLSGVHELQDGGQMLKYTNSW